MQSYLNEHILPGRSIKRPEMDSLHLAEQVDNTETIPDATKAVYPPFTHPESQIRLLRVSGEGDSLTCESHVFYQDKAPAYEAIS